MIPQAPNERQYIDRPHDRITQTSIQPPPRLDTPHSQAQALSHRLVVSHSHTPKVVNGKPATDNKSTPRPTGQRVSIYVPKWNIIRRFLTSFGLPINQLPSIPSGLAEETQQFAFSAQPLSTVPQCLKSGSDNRPLRH